MSGGGQHCKNLDPRHTPTKHTTHTGISTHTHTHTHTHRKNLDGIHRKDGAGLGPFEFNGRDEGEHARPPRDLPQHHQHRHRDYQLSIMKMMIKTKNKK